MDEDNMPMAFPNGYVYSREVGHSLALKSAAQIFDRHWKKWQRKRGEWSLALVRIAL